MPTDPKDVKWLTAGTTAKPAGIPIKLNDTLRASVASLLNSQAGPTPTPTPTPTPPPVVVKDPDFPDTGIPVKPTDNFQAMLDAAKPGTVFGLLAGATYKGGWMISKVGGITITGYDPNTQTGRPVVVAPADSNAISVPAMAGLSDLTFRRLILRPSNRDPDQASFDKMAVGDGLVINGAVNGVTLDRIDSRFFQQNFVLEGDHDRVTMMGCTSAFAWAVATPKNDFMYKGQGVYIDVTAKTGKQRVSVSDCVFVRNGWHPALPPTVRTAYRHNMYVQKTSMEVDVNRCAFVDGGNFGCQLRPGGAVSSSFFLNNANHLGCFGNTQLAGSVMLGGERYFDGTNWTGQTGIMSWADLVSLASCQILALPNQEQPDTPPPGHPAAKSYGGPAIMLSNSYPKPHQDWASKAPKLTAIGCSVAWPDMVLRTPTAAVNTVPGIATRARPSQYPSWCKSAGNDLLMGSTTVLKLIKLSSGV